MNTTTTTPNGARRVPDLTVVPRLEFKHLLSILLDVAGDAGAADIPAYQAREIAEAVVALVEVHKAEALDASLELSVSGTLQAMIDVQTAPGTYDYDPYMHGMANALLLAQSVVLHTDVNYLEAPEVWLADLPDDPSISPSTDGTGAAAT